MLPDNMGGQGLVWRIGAEEEEVIRFAFLNKVPLTSQQLGLLAKFMGISLRLIGKTASVDQAAQYARAIAQQSFPELDVPARLSLIRSIVEPMATATLAHGPVLALVLDEMSKDNPSYKDFEGLHQQVKGQMAAPAVDEHASRAGCPRGPTIQVTDILYRAGHLMLSNTCKHCINTAHVLTNFMVIAIYPECPGHTPLI